MSKKEESLRRSVLSREGQDRDRAAKRRAAQALITTAVVASGFDELHARLHRRRIETDAERGRFSGGDFHPDQCSCAKCSTWRKGRPEI